MIGSRAFASAAIALCGVLGGCGIGPAVDNPSFAITEDRAERELRALRATPVTPTRPILVIGGLFDVGVTSDALGNRVGELIGPSADVLAVSMWGTSTIEDCRIKVLNELESRFPSDDPDWTREVDVIGFSLGGVVARYAAMSPEDRAGVYTGVQEGAEDRLSARGRKRLKISQLFCISVPNTGCEAAEPPTLDDRVIAIRRRSPFLLAIDRVQGAWGTTLDDRERAAFAFPIYAYARLDDAIVGAENAGIGVRPPWWVSNRLFEVAHGDAYRDPRILADIARRLRGEPAYATEPATPVPEWDR